MNTQRHSERELEILTAIGERRPLTQRALAARMGVAVGLANLYLKRLAKKGYIKVVEFPRKPSAGKRLRYLLTTRGIAEKSRLTYEHITYALRLYARARETLRDSLGLLPEQGVKRIALCGTGEAAELAYLTLRESGIEPIGVFDGDPGKRFLGMAVQPLRELDAGTVDAVVLATFDQPDQYVADLEALGVARSKILTLRRVTPTRNGARP